MVLAESRTYSHYNGTEVSRRANSIKDIDTSLSNFVRCGGGTRVMDSEWRPVSTSSHKQQILYIYIYIYIFIYIYIYMRVPVAARSKA